MISATRAFADQLYDELLPALIEQTNDRAAATQLMICGVLYQALEVRDCELRSAQCKAEADRIMRANPAARKLLTQSSHPSPAGPCDTAPAQTPLGGRLVYTPPSGPPIYTPPSYPPPAQTPLRGRLVYTPPSYPTAAGPTPYSPPVYVPPGGLPSHPRPVGAQSSTPDGGDICACGRRGGEPRGRRDGESDRVIPSLVGAVDRPQPELSRV